ncbi:MAG: DNA translocase FtsK [Ignavibacteriae bacterium]|nr:DNA translocase FtsK [Ignavibacteriota bacterium]
MILTIVIAFKIALKDALREAGEFFSPVSSKLKPVFGKVTDTVSSELDKFAYKTVEQSEKLNIENLVPFTKTGLINRSSSENYNSAEEFIDEQEEFEPEEPVRIIRRNLSIDVNRNQSIESEEPISSVNPKISDFTKINTIINNEEEILNSVNKRAESISNHVETSNKGNKISEQSVNDLLEKLKSDLVAKHILIDEETPSNEKPLTIEVNETPAETKVETNFFNPLSTSIHDEKIKYKVPALDFLEDEETVTKVNEEELKINAKILQEKLETFKIIIQNLTVTPGPVVTMYEFVPAPGIKISKIESYADDIAMALKARGIRVLAPIPGKGTVGIEIPNHKPTLVRLGNVIKSNKYQQSDYKLPIALGKTISGEVYMTDLTRMPHLLIAGSTGSGKSVGINSIITSLIYKLHPKDLKFVIIDPKKVELRQYSALKNHFLAISPDINEPIITSPEDSVIALKAICAEMDLRYDILAEVGQRNIFEYNRKVAEGKIKAEDGKVYREMPFIVLIIDELADLMLTSAKEVESPIIRLAQLARAVGIHLVLATQRPSVDVITGIIKANFPARISYLVASRVDSRTILDDGGAEQLLGNGDMLFLPSGSPKPIRIQNAFISTEEVEKICESLSKQKGYSQPYMLPSLVDKCIRSDKLTREDCDPLFEEAARLVIRHQQGSISMLQRRLKIGFARAGKIIDELEIMGVVGPSDGSKARSVIMDSESELEAVL